MIILNKLNRKIRFKQSFKETNLISGVRDEKNPCCLQGTTSIHSFPIHKISITVARDLNSSYTPYPRSGWNYTRHIFQFRIWKGSNRTQKYVTCRTKSP